MMAQEPIRIATRASQLALAQTQWVINTLAKVEPDWISELVIVRTTGDRAYERSVDSPSAKEWFTKEIDEMVLRGEADFAVHSLKDLPTQLPPALCLAAIPKREDPRDVFVATRPIDWRTSKDSISIGTSSARRKSQLLHINDSLTISPLRGNVTTRVRKVWEGEFDAIVVALAGLNRLEIKPPYVDAISVEECPPAPGQGALGLVARKDYEKIRQVLSHLDDRDALQSCQAERAFLQALGANCQLALGAYGCIVEDKIILEGMILSADGKQVVRKNVEGPRDEPEMLGAKLASVIQKHKNYEICYIPNEESIETPMSTPPLATGPLQGKEIIVTRDEDLDGPLSRALLSLGAEVFCFSLIEHRPPEDLRELDEALGNLDAFDLLLFTSARAVSVAVESLRRQGRTLAEYSGQIACVGPATAKQAKASGALRVIAPQIAAGEALLKEIQTEIGTLGSDKPHSVLFPHADRSDPRFSEMLRVFGCEVFEIVAYRTMTTNRWVAPLMQRLRAKRCDILTLASASASEALLEVCGAYAISELSQSIKLATIGPSTSAPLRQAGIEPAVESQDHSFEGLASAIADFVASD